MTQEEKEILAIAQSIFLARNGRYNDIEDDQEELDAFIDANIDWINQIAHEIELEADWQYLRENDVELDIIPSDGQYKAALPPDVRKLIVSPYRQLTITQDGSTVATFSIVNPNQLRSHTHPYENDRAAIVGNEIVFSRPFKEEEVGGAIIADVLYNMPLLSRDDVSLLSSIKPRELIILGVAKNDTLPDIVQGGISPALAQKYADLLEKAVAENNATSDTYDVYSEGFGWIRGVW